MDNAIENDYIQALGSGETEIRHCYRAWAMERKKKEILKTFKWQNRQGNLVDLREVPSSYFNNIVLFIKRNDVEGVWKLSDFKFLVTARDKFKERTK